jgi:hypothetical protein
VPDILYKGRVLGPPYFPTLPESIQKKKKLP